MLFRADDRGVRDSERKAALMHFDSDQVSWQSYNGGPGLGLELG